MFGACVALMTSCDHTEHHAHPKSTFKVSGAVQKDTIIHQEYVCQIRAHQHIELRALETGYLQNILVDEGEHVHKGQLLFQIQPTVYQAEALSAQAEVEFARIEYENSKALAEQDIISPNEVALAQAQLEKAKAELKLAEAHLGFTEIRAPFDGIIGKFEDVRLGSILEEGELLTTLSDNGKMWVYFNVPEAEYLNYAMSSHDANEHVHLRLANNQVFSEEGIIETIESDFNNTTGNIAFRATFQNPKGLLRHGQTGTILWPKKLEAVTMIPQRATFEVLDKKFVFLVDSDGAVRSHEIKIEDELDHIYFLKEGLTLSDRYLLEGLRKVQNGDHIAFDFVSPELVFADLHLHAE